jgi:hypothetical protein
MAEPTITNELIAVVAQAAAELIENVADSEGVDAQELTNLVVERLATTYVT